MENKGLDITNVSPTRILELEKLAKKLVKEVRKKARLPKDSLKRIVEIMEFVEGIEKLSNKNKENTKFLLVAKKQILEKRFGEEGFYLFRKYCLSNKFENDYAYERDGAFYLTQLGMRKLHELRGTLAQEKRDVIIKWTTIAIATTAIVQIIRLFI